MQMFLCTPVSIQITGKACHRTQRIILNDRNSYSPDHANRS